MAMTLASCTSRLLMTQAMIRNLHWRSVIQVQIVPCTSMCESAIANRFGLWLLYIRMLVSVMATCSAFWCCRWSSQNWSDWRCWLHRPWSATCTKGWVHNLIHMLPEITTSVSFPELCFKMFLGHAVWVQQVALVVFSLICTHPANLNATYTEPNIPQDSCFWPASALCQNARCKATEEVANDHKALGRLNPSLSAHILLCLCHCASAITKMTANTVRTDVLAEICIVPCGSQTQKYSPGPGRVKSKYLTICA